MSSIDAVRQMLAKYNQEHILAFYDELTKDEQKALEEQIKTVNFDEINSLYEGTKTKPKLEKDIIEPMKYVDKYKLDEETRMYYEKLGENIIKSGKYAVATMAGGQRYKTWSQRTKGNL